MARKSNIQKIAKMTGLEEACIRLVLLTEGLDKAIEKVQGINTEYPMTTKKNRKPWERTVKECDELAWYCYETARTIEKILKSKGKK